MSTTLYRSFPQSKQCTIHLPGPRSYRCGELRFNRGSRGVPVWMSATVHFARYSHIHEKTADKVPADVWEGRAFARFLGPSGNPRHDVWSRGSLAVVYDWSHETNSEIFLPRIDRKAAIAKALRRASGSRGRKRFDKASSLCPFPPVWDTDVHYRALDFGLSRPVSLFDEYDTKPNLVLIRAIMSCPGFIRY